MYFIVHCLEVSGKTTKTCQYRERAQGRNPEGELQNMQKEL
jgi:hypothetical protein